MKQGKESEVNKYVGIYDMPVGIWWDIVEGKVKAPNNIQEIEDEFLEEFGLSELLRDVYNLEAHIQLFENYIALGQIHFKTMVVVKKIQLEKLRGRLKGKPNSTLYIVEKTMGFEVDPYKTSIWKYYDRLRNIEKENKAKIANQKTKNGQQ